MISRQREKKEKKERKENEISKSNRTSIVDDKTTSIINHTNINSGVSAVLSLAVASLYFKNNSLEARVKELEEKQDILVKNLNFLNIQFKILSSIVNSQVELDFVDRSELKDLIIDIGEKLKK